MFLPSPDAQKTISIIFFALWIIAFLLFLIAMYFLLKRKSMATKAHKIIQIHMLISSLVADTGTLLSKPIFIPELPGLILINVVPLDKSLSTFMIGTINLLGAFYLISSFTFGGFYRMEKLHADWIKFTKKLKLFWMFFAIIGVILINVLTWDLYFGGHFVSDLNRICLKNKQLCNVDNVVWIELTDFSYLLFKIAIPFFMAFVIVCAFLSLSAIHDFTKKSKQLSRRTRELQLYFTIVFLYQLLLALIFICIPYLILVACIQGLLQGIVFTMIAAFCTLFFNLHSILNCLTIIFVTKSYRKIIIGWITSILCGNPLKKLPKTVKRISQRSNVSITHLPMNNNNTVRLSSHP